MAALNFPDPNVTTSYTNPDTGITYEWANGVWKSVSSALTAPELFVDVDGDNLTGNLTLGTDKIVLNATTGAAAFADNVSVDKFLTVTNSTFSSNAKVQIQGDNDVAISVYPVTAGARTIELKHDGSASFAAAATAPFFSVSNGVFGTDNVYASLQNTGDRARLFMSNTDALGDNEAVIDITKGASGTEVLRVNANGSATFAGSVSTEQQFNANRTSGSSTVFSGSLNGAQKTKITADGSASFAGGNVNIDSSGRLLSGTSSALTGTNAQYSRFVVQGASSGSAFDGRISLSRGTAASSLTADSTVGSIYFTDISSNEFAAITAAVDGTTGAADAPGRLVFATTEDGASSPTERMRIDSNGFVKAKAGRFLVQTSDSGTGDTDGLALLVDGNTDAYVWNYENTSLRFGTNNTEAMRLDADGRLLVGTSSSTNSDALLKVQAYAGNTSAEGQIAIACGVTNPLAFIGALLFTDSSDGAGAYVAGVRDGGTWHSGTSHPSRLSFAVAADGASSPTERMRISSTGVVRTSRGLVIGSITNTITSNDALIISGNAIGSGSGTYALKWNSSSGIVTYDTSSRLVKENIVDCPYGLETLKQLHPRKYFRTDDQQDEIGFVADELAEVMPEFVPFGPKRVITKNDEDTEEIALGVNYEKLTAVLTKALQEAIAKIETLEQRLSDAGIA